MAADESAVPVRLAFDLQFRSDPIGAALEVQVPQAPSEDSREALLDSIEGSLVGRRGNLVFQTVQQAHEQLAAYGDRNDYDVQPVIDSFAGVDARRDRTSVHAEWHWTHEAAQYFALGTSDHTIEGDPLLVFAFDGDAYPGLDELFPGGVAFLQEVKVSGLPASRFVRDSLAWLRREVGQ